MNWIHLGTETCNYGIAEIDYNMYSSILTLIFSGNISNTYCVPDAVLCGEYIKTYNQVVHHLQQWFSTGDYLEMLETCLDVTSQGRYHLGMLLNIP